MPVRERFMAHLKAANYKEKAHYKIYNAIRKYGKENFYVETLEDGIPLSNLDEKEIEYISEYDSFHNGYNSTPGGDGRIINKLNNEDELLSLAKQGVNSYQLAEKFHVDNITVLRTLHKLGFYYYKIDDSEIIDMVAKGLSNKEIADIFNKHPDTISRHLQKNNERRRRLPLNKRDNFDYNSMFEDYKNQMSIAEICEKYDLSESVFNRAREEYGIEARTK